MKRQPPAKIKKDPAGLLRLVADMLQIVQEITKDEITLTFDDLQGASKDQIQSLVLTYFTVTLSVFQDQILKGTATDRN